MKRFGIEFCGGDMGARGGKGVLHLTFFTAAIRKGEPELC
jgi:hypothetical protein